MYYFFKLYVIAQICSGILLFEAVVKIIADYIVLTTVPVFKKIKT